MPAIALRRSEPRAVQSRLESLSCAAQYQTRHGILQMISRHTVIICLADRPYFPQQL